MKKLSLFLLILFSTTWTWAQSETFHGSWDIVDFKMTRSYAPDTLKPDSFVQDVNHQDQEALQKDSAVWNLLLNADSSLVQTSNMRTGEIESWKGTWEATDKQLRLNLEIGDRILPIIYTYELVENGFELRRQNPKGTLIIQVIFTRAKED